MESGGSFSLSYKTRNFLGPSPFDGFLFSKPFSFTVSTLGLAIEDSPVLIQPWTTCTPRSLPTLVQELYLVLSLFIKHRSVSVSFFPLSKGPSSRNGPRFPFPHITIFLYSLCLIFFIVLTPPLCQTQDVFVLSQPVCSLGSGGRRVLVTLGSGLG